MSETLPFTEEGKSKGHWFFSSLPSELMMSSLNLDDFTVGDCFKNILVFRELQMVGF